MSIWNLQTNMYRAHYLIWLGLQRIGAALVLMSQSTCYTTIFVAAGGGETAQNALNINRHCALCLGMLETLFWFGENLVFSKTCPRRNEISLFVVTFFFSFFINQRAACPARLYIIDKLEKWATERWQRWSWAQNPAIASCQMVFVSFSYIIISNRHCRTNSLFIWDDQKKKTTTEMLGLGFILLEPLFRLNVRVVL